MSLSRSSFQTHLKVPSVTFPKPTYYWLRSKEDHLFRGGVCQCDLLVIFLSKKRSVFGFLQFLRKLVLSLFHFLRETLFCFLHFLGKSLLRLLHLFRQFLLRLLHFILKVVFDGRRRGQVAMLTEILDRQWCAAQSHCISRWGCDLQSTLGGQNAWLHHSEMTRWMYCLEEECSMLWTYLVQSVRSQSVATRRLSQKAN